jgi:hypothetical protein
MKLPFALLLVVGSSALWACSSSSGEPTDDTTQRDTTATDAGAPPPGIAGSQLTDALTTAGLDAHNLPALDSLDRATKKKVMQTFATSLGVDCDYCHADSVEAQSHQQIAARMYSDFVRGLALKDGSVLYCDSCHSGKADFLDRSDSQKLKAFMDNNFIQKLKRADGTEHKCKTCHGSPFAGDIFKDLWHAE